MKPGEYLLSDKAIIANEGREVVTIKVTNTGDRPVQVGSHFHFFEVNRALQFDRATAYGRRLNIPSGTAVRFEPGQAHEVELTTFGGNGIVHGFNGLVEGKLSEKKSEALNKIKAFEQP